MKSKHDAVLSFILSLGFFLPLFNYILVPTALILSIMSIFRIKRMPHKFTGIQFAVAGFIISSIALIAIFVDLALRIFV